MRLAVIWLLCAASLVRADRPLVVLRAEHARYSEIDGSIAGRLLRELGRQAVLVAARDELGAVTRDETLGELARPPETSATVDWTPLVRTRWRGDLELKLRETEDGKPVDDLIIDADCRFGLSSLYPGAASKWEDATREVIADRLREAGVEGEVPPFNADNRPSRADLRLLDQLNIVSQWESVSRAHRAIASDGPSLEWLTVLSRGYAHLGTLTDHHWNAKPEAFYARAMLYAERARTFGAKGSGAEWLRPYALAMCGAHGAAVAEMKNLEPYEPGDLPDWARVISPVSRFDREALRELGEDEPSLRPMTAWLNVALSRTLGTHRSFHDTAYESIEVNPDAYGVYSDLVTVYPSLGDQRYGAGAGPIALARFSIERLAEVEGLPSSFREALPGDEKEARELAVRLDDANPRDPFLPTVDFLIDGLREAEAGRARPLEPSWESLASLIEEERFVMIANYCESLLNATEADLAEPVQALVTLLEGHPYAGYIATYALSRAEETQAIEEVMGGVEIIDPRHNMRPMIWKAMRLAKRGGDTQTPGHRASWEALWSCDYRLPSLVEDYEIGMPYWWSRIDRRSKGAVTFNYKTVSPEAPHWLRSVMSQTRRPTPENLEEWADSAARDAVCSSRMSRYYLRKGKIDAATRWSQTAYELEPDARSVMALAKLYREHGEEERWLPTLERYLEEHERRGLGHSHVQSYIAETLMHEERDYETAAPFAEAAAETHSASSLATAMEANEGLARWERAEEYAYTLSSQYPSTSGSRWYFYCRRTGQGDADAAKPLLAAAFTADTDNRLLWEKACYPYLEGDSEAALEAFHSIGAQTNQIYWYLTAAIIALEMDDAERAEDEAATAHALAVHYTREKDPALYDAVIACAELIKAREVTDTEKLLRALDRLTPLVRRDYQFFAGAILNAIDVESDLADELLGAAVATPPLDSTTCHLAGHVLAKKYGVSRTMPIEPLGGD